MCGVITDKLKTSGFAWRFEVIEEDAAHTAHLVAMFQVEILVTLLLVIFVVLSTIDAGLSDE